MNTYQFTDDMAELSGFGGAYEQACRNMVVAGMEHLTANPGAELKYTDHGFSDNAAAKALDDAIAAACDGCTGAMLGAARNHAVYAYRNGWEAYCAESRKMQAERAAKVSP